MSAQNTGSGPKTWVGPKKQAQRTQYFFGGHFSPTLGGISLDFQSTLQKDGPKKTISRHFHRRSTWNQSSCTYKMILHVDYSCTSIPRYSIPSAIRFCSTHSMFDGLVSKFRSGGIVNVLRCKIQPASAIHTYVAHVCVCVCVSAYAVRVEFSPFRTATKMEPCSENETRERQSSNSYSKQLACHFTADRIQMQRNLQTHNSLSQTQKMFSVFDVCVMAIARNMPENIKSNINVCAVHICIDAVYSFQVQFLSTENSTQFSISQR